MSPSRKAKFTVCLGIPTFNREKVLVDTLKQVLDLKPSADEVIVVDQTKSHEPETENYLKKQAKTRRIKWIKQELPNKPKALNRLLKETATDVLVVIDDDVLIPKKDFLSKHLLNYLKEDVVAVAGRVTQPKGFKYHVLPPKYDKKNEYKYFPINYTKRKEWLATYIGCNYSVKVDFMKSIGGYDENFIGSAYKEEIDSALRIWKAGGNIVFDPKAHINHLAAPSGGARLNQFSEWKVSFSSNYFSAKHYFPGPYYLVQTFLDIHRYVFRRTNVNRPWILPYSFICFLYSWIKSLFLGIKNRNSKWI